MSELDDIYYDWYEFQLLAGEVTDRLRRMSMMQNKMHWQFGDPEWYEKFVSAMDDAKGGWMSSNC